MTLDEVNKAIEKGEAKFVPQPELPNPEIPPLDDMAKFFPILEMLRRPKSYLATAPTFTPKSFLEQIQFYDDGANRRIYLYVNGTWRYSTLT